MTRPLPPRPHLEHLRAEAKDLLRACRAGDADALRRVGAHRPLPEGVTPRLCDAQFALAREYGFASWPRLTAHVQALAAPAPDSAPPEEWLRRVQAHYLRLRSFSMAIEHSDSSGLYPGAFTQLLHWRAGGRFTLTVTTRAQGQERQAPDFYADGERVVALFPDGSRREDALTPRPNSTPGWEVTGGPILSWLQRTPTGDLLLGPPPSGGTAAWSVGPRVRWRGRAARELVCEAAFGGQTSRASYFLGRDRDTLLGFEWDGNGRLGYAVYRDQREDPPLPDTLGQPPPVMCGRDGTPLPPALRRFLDVVGRARTVRAEISCVDGGWQADNTASVTLERPNRIRVVSRAGGRVVSTLVSDGATLRAWNDQDRVETAAPPSLERVMVAEPQATIAGSVAAFGVDNLLRAAQIAGLGTWDDGGDEAVAGRPARRLVCDFRDAVYTLWLDASTGLPVRSHFTGNGRPYTLTYGVVLDAPVPAGTFGPAPA